MPGLVRVAMAAVLVFAAEAWTPPRFVEGEVPRVAPLAVSGGQVFLDVSVTAAGRVADVVPLRVTPPFTEAFAAAVRTWIYRPAQRVVAFTREGDPIRQPADAHVLAAEIVRPPTLATPTLGEPPRDVAPAPEGIPYPTSIVTPPYPPTALSDGSVLIEMSIDERGRVADTTIRRSSPAFDAAAVAAARQWSFRPARANGAAVASTACVVFVFRQVVT